MEKSLQLRIDEILAAEQQKMLTRERSGKWSPSSFGKCLRNQYWNRKNEPKTNLPDARSLRVFRAGDLFHDFVQDILKNDENVCEMPVTAEDVFGYADLVGKDEVMEIKSQHSKAFWWAAKDDFDIKVEKADHVLQATAYAVFLGKEYIRLIYISKDDLCISEHVLKVTDEMKQAVTNELNNLRSFWDKEQLPPALPRLYVDKKTGKPKECQYCNWKDKCFKMEGWEIEDKGQKIGV